MIYGLLFWALGVLVMYVGMYGHYQHQRRPGPWWPVFKVLWLYDGQKLGRASFRKHYFIGWRGHGWWVETDKRSWNLR